jgi:uncharacterized membrane protein YhaH (DUF805 family)
VIQAVTTCFKKYLTFSGRAARSEFWYFIFFLFLVHILLVVLNSALFGPQVSQFQRFNADGDLVGTGFRYNYNGGVFGTVFGIATLIPWLAVGWRRMQDIGREGFWPWIAILGYLGLAVLTLFGAAPSSAEVQGTVIAVLFGVGSAVFLLNLYWLTRPSQPAPNKYGPYPHEVPQ